MNRGNTRSVCALLSIASLLAAGPALGEEPSEPALVPLPSVLDFTRGDGFGLHGRLRSEVKRGIDYLLRFHADGEAGEARESSVSCPEHLHSLMKLRPDMEVWISLPPEQLHVLEPGES